MTGGVHDGRPFLRAGLVDSFGLAFGWTVFLLHATIRQGVASAALYQCAMFVGVAASAPFSRWASARLGGRPLIRRLAASEATTRAGIFLLVVVRAPVGATAAVVVAMNVLAWTGYAAMRAEVAGSDVGSSALTRYALRVAASEAAAAAAATLLPMRSTGALLVAAAVYVAALGPTWWVAGQARNQPVVGPAVDPAGRRVLARRCTGGGVVMLVAGGPALMGTVLSFHYFGRVGVLVSATSFAVGSLLSPRLGAAVAGRERRRLARWSALGVLMAAGWIAAPFSLVALGLAQLVGGAAQTAFEGGMDTDLTEQFGGMAPTAVLAYGTAARALGGAVTLAVLPTLLDHVPLAGLAAVTTTLLVAGTALVRSSRDGRAVVAGTVAAAVVGPEPPRGATTGR